MIAKTWQRGSTFQKVLALLIPILLFRFFFSATIGLIDDEAYHWSWAKELALSYFDHPGMVAWLESVSTALLGDTELGVRLPSFLCYLTTLILAMNLAWDLFDEWAAYFVAFMMLFSPLWGVGGYVASPEPIFMMFWTAAAWVFWQGVREDENRWSIRKTWICLGVLMGLGLNSKFPMALLAPGFGLYLLMTPARRKDLLSPWPWVGVLIATLICLPIFVWNQQVDWPGFRYQFHDRHTGESFSLARWFVWWAAQLLFMTPFAYALLMLTLLRSWIRRHDPRWRFIFALAIPTLAIFTVQPLFADYKPHWPAPAYFILTLGAGTLWNYGFTFKDREWLRPRSKVLTWGILAFIVPLNLFVYSTFAGPWMPKVYRWSGAEKPWNTTWDFSNEFTGWKELGAYANQRQREIHAETGRRPFIAALRYETVAQTFWATKQKAYHMSTTPSHYTINQNLTNAFENMKGLDALVVTTEKYQSQPMKWGRFDSCEPEILRTYRGIEHARTFTLWYCRNFQGVLQ